MYLSRLRLTNFRNHADTQISPSPGINLIVGANAQGKTNLLEGIVCLSRGHGYRTRRDSELIRFGEDAARVEGVLSGGEREYELSLTLGQRRAGFVNGVRQRKMQDFAQSFHTVVFSPEDLDLVRGAAAGRRRFLDTSLCSLRPTYARLFAEYNRLHAHIVRILREGNRDGLLDDFSYRLTCIGARMIPYRAAFCRALGEAAGHFHSEIAPGEELGVSYETVGTVQDPEAPVQKIAEELWAHYLAHRDAELRAGSVLSGPHRDDLVFSVGGQPAREFASQGQARTAAIACKLAEREIFRKNDGIPPVLLLDDVLSELDGLRRAYILSGIRGGQVFITACDAAPGEIAAQRVFTVRGGAVIEEEAPEAPMRTGRDKEA